MSGERVGAKPAPTIRWWARQDLNLGPTDYESAALTAELRALPDCNSLHGKCFGRIRLSLEAHRGLHERRNVATGARPGRILSK